MSRREQIVMTAAEIDRYLDSQLTVIVISNGSTGYPHPMPMHFCVYPDRAIGMTTYRKSQKVLNFQRDPKATLLVESGEHYEELRSVLIYARTEIIDDRDQTAECMQACRRHSNGARGNASTPAEDAEFAEISLRRAEKRLVLKFHPEQYISWDHGKLDGVY
ncbi:MAG: pyridoxamine 5'-phosphate oxidase family protein [Gammaproteobacteria bacterium]